MLFSVSNNKFFQVSFTIYKKAGNDWKMTPFRIPKIGFCDWARDDQLAMAEFIKNSGLPPKGSCPAMPKVNRSFEFVEKNSQIWLSQGKYNLSDTDVSAVNVPPNFSGEYHFNQKFYRNDKVTDEVDFYFEITQFDRF
jgi:hypothetical protein